MSCNVYHDEFFESQSTYIYGQEHYTAEKPYITPVSQRLYSKCIALISAQREYAMTRLQQVSLD